MPQAAAYIPYVMMAAAAAGEYVNTQNTAKRQDKQAAQSIIDQGNIQKQADAKVSDTIQQLQGSTADKAREQRLNDYMGQVQRGQAKAAAGLTGQPVGGDAFQADAVQAAQGVQNYGQTTANLLSRIDAPAVQRQDEGTAYGNLATDLGLIGRESQGQAFMDQLRMNAIRRNAKIDLAAGLLNSGAGMMAGGMGGTGGYDTNISPTRVKLASRPLPASLGYGAGQVYA